MSDNEKSVEINGAVCTPTKELNYEQSAFGNINLPPEGYKGTLHTKDNKPAVISNNEYKYSGYFDGISTSYQHTEQYTEKDQTYRKRHLAFASLVDGKIENQNQYAAVQTLKEMGVKCIEERTGEVTAPPMTLKDMQKLAEVSKENTGGRGGR